MGREVQDQGLEDKSFGAGLGGDAAIILYLTSVAPLHLAGYSQEGLKNCLWITSFQPVSSREPGLSAGWTRRAVGDFSGSELRVKHNSDKRENAAAVLEDKCTYRK